jgi:tetratricopeptide (TPR) repeat protein
MIFAIAALMGLAMQVHAQAPAQHQLKLKGNPTPLVGTVLGADGRSVQFQTVAGTVGYPLQNVENVTMPAPPELGQALAAMQSGDAEKALPLAQGVSQKYRGLPADWAKLAATTTANLLISAGKLDEAEAAFKQLEALYPGGGGLQAKVGLARIAVAKKEFAAAKESLGPITEAALKEKNVPRENAFAYSQAFYAMGLINESEEKPQEALQNYLRTVTIFFHDPAARADAQQHADALRAQNKDKPASEQIAVP